MAEHDGHDPDRAAIMARRRQFIAVALGGLASGCTPAKPNPQPTTTGETTTTTTTDGTTTGGTTMTSESETGESETGETDTGSETETGETGLKFDLLPEPGTDTGDETDTGTETGPQPCLAPTGAL